MKKVLTGMAAVCLLALWLTSSALATHPRPGGASPVRDAFVPAFIKCGGAATTDDPVVDTPNTQHLPPLSLPSCNPPVLKSNILTTGTIGQMVGFFRVDVVCNPSSSGPPPCLGVTGDQEDVTIGATLSGVRCQVPLGARCATAGDLYNGYLLLPLSFRLTDHSNGNPPTICTNSQGNPPCTVATMEDMGYMFAVPCTNGSCNFTTSLDMINPGTVIEFQREVFTGLRLVELLDDPLDAGPCVQANPPNGAGCTIGTPNRFASTGWFAP